MSIPLQALSFLVLFSGCGCILNFQMLSLRILSFLNRPPLSSPPVSLSNKPINTFISQSLTYGDDFSFKKGRAQPSSFSSYIVRAVEKDSHQFEVDPDKAREALQELDQQLQSFSEKKISLPKIRASDVKFTKEQMTDQEEFSDSYLAYSAIGLVLFTILYNIFFETVIKAAVDIPLVAPATTAVTEASKDQTSN
ncbi:hypothetical protein I3842_13G157800 [Carya illinoinensis]|uniref:Uncharacterized protein n=1 Tax=Carya illinoinensis TaxID=32201 RepID=A0A922DE70_CARIL|nr:hypothetical protein I3842_13G157800 [Carya illinoinensis]